MNRRDIAHAAREFGQATGLDGFGKRGRVSENLVFQYLSSLKPADVRASAEAVGVTIRPKGSPTQAELVSVAGAVARNATPVEATP